MGSVPYKGNGDAGLFTKMLNKTLDHAMLVRHAHLHRAPHTKNRALQSTVMASAGAPH